MNCKNLEEELFALSHETEDNFVTPVVIRYMELETNYESLGMGNASRYALNQLKAEISNE